MRGRLTDISADAKSLEVTRQAGLLSHSNSLGNKTIKDMAGCRAFNRKSIVTGGVTDGSTAQNAKNDFSLV